MPDDLPDDFSDDLLEELPDDLPDDLSDDLLEELPDDLSDDLLEELPDDPPPTLPVPTGLTGRDMAELMDPDDYATHSFPYGTTKKWFELDGMPIRMLEVNQVPERLNPETGEWELFPLGRVMWEARSIEQHEFDELVAKAQKQP